MSTYNINIPVNKFFYSGLNLNNTGTVFATGLPSGLFFNNQKNTISGHTQYTGNFYSYIYYNNSPNIQSYQLAFNVYTPKNTGYLYAFGPGSVYQESHIPSEFSTTLVESIIAASGYNLASASQQVYIPVIEKSGQPPIPPVVIDIVNRNIPYSFVLKNNSSEDCISDFVFSSSITGNNPSGYLDNSLIFSYASGTIGSISTLAIVAESNEISPSN